MRTKSKKPIPTALAKAARRFERFREQNKPRARLPKKLWTLAVNLAREHGLNRTAQVLGLGYGSLSKKLGAARHQDEPDFIELLPGGLSPGPECTIELEDGFGATMRIHLKGEGAEVPDLAAITVAFRRGER